MVLILSGIFNKFYNNINKSLINFKSSILRLIKRSYLDELLKKDAEKYEYSTKYYDKPKTLKERWKRFWREEPNEIGF